MIPFKRLFSLVLCLAMLLSMAPASVLAETAGVDSSTESVNDEYSYPEEDSSWIESTGYYSYMDLEVLASSTDVSVGDTITYTVYAYGYDILAMDFGVYIPEGLSYVPGSAQIPSEAQEITGWETLTWSEDSLTWSGLNEWSTQFSGGAPVLTFSCVAEAEGEYVVMLTDAIAYDSMNMDLFAYVYEDTVAVSGAKKTLYFDATGTGWSDVYCLAWNEAVSSDDAWPGTMMKPESNFWKIEVPYGTTGIFVSDDNGNQTYDITISGDRDAWIVVSDDYMSANVSYEAPVPMPVPANSGESAVVLSTTSYYVAGVNTLCGSTWDPCDVDNIMTLGQDGLYTKVYENVPAGSYELKVTDGTWNNSWGNAGTGDNYVVTVEATSTVTVIFDPETGTIDTDVVPVEGELPVEPEYITVYVSIDSETVPIAWAWGDYGDAFSEWPGEAMTSMKGNIYSCRVSVEDTYIIFNNGDANQTADLTIPTDDNNLYTYSTDTWSVYDPNAADFYIVVGTEGLCGSDWHPADMNNLMVLDPDTGIYTKTYENVPVGNYELKVTKNGLIENNYNHQGVIDGDNVQLAITGDGANVIVTFDGEKVQVTVVGAGCVHSFDDYVSNNDATCEDGTKTATCDHCGATKTVPDVGSALGHVFEGEWQLEISNSCTTDGLQTRSCSRCGGIGTTVLTTDLPSCTGSGYANNMNKYFPAIAVEGAAKYEITLSANSALESNYDYLYVYAQDAEGVQTEVGQYTGDIGGEVIIVNGPVAVLRMITDVSVTEYGFEVASVKVYYSEGYQVIPATGHSYEAVVTAPTCTEDGFTTYTCSVCSDSYVGDEVAALGHDLNPDTWTLIAAPTCSSNGEESNTCLRCGETQTRSVQALAHTFEGDWVEINPVTCTEDGVKVKVCSVCGAQGMWTVTDGLPGVNEYEYVAYMDMVFPTVTVPGASQIILHFDSNSTLESSFDHLYVYAGDAADSSNQVADLTGYFGDQTVTIYGDSFTLRMTTDGSVSGYGFQVTSLTCFGVDAYQVLPATGHNYESVVTAPTCTEGGYTTYTCANCEDAYNADYVDALGHDIDPDTWTLNVAPTCSSNGEESNTCLRCGETQTRSVQALSHTFDGDWVEINPVTCTEDGVKVKICSVCEAQGMWTVTDGLPGVSESEYVAYMDMVFPTVTVPGASQIILHFDSNSTLENSYDRLYVYAGDAVDSSNQVAYLTGYFGDQTVTIDGDSFTLRMTTDGSITNYGFQVTSLTCLIVDAYQVLPATGHNYESVVTAPTCTEVGYTTYTCTICEDAYNADYVDALGHDLDSEGWSQVQAPTCVADGYQTNTCLRCSEVVTEAIPATGHSLGEEWTTQKEVTCTEDGLRVKQCTVCEGWSATILTEGLPSCTGSEYTHSMNKVFPTVTIPGAVRLALRFSDSSALESNYDKLYVYAGTNTSGTLVNTLSGYFGGTTVTVDAESVTLKMTTDHSVVRAGFQVVEVIGYSADGYEIIPALGHDYSDWVVITEPDCENEGYQEKTCSGCNDIVYEELPNLGHIYGEWTLISDPTCTTDGRSEQVCERCNGVNADITPALGHDFVYSETIQPTCTADGAEISICSRCSEESRKSISARHVDLDNNDFCDYCGNPFVGVLDLVFVIDTTGSMGGAIEVVKRNITNYANFLAESNIPYYIAVVDYRDFADRAGAEDYPYSVIQDFSNDIDVILAGVNRLSTGYGGDGPETVYSGLMTGLDELNWGEGSIRRVVLIGDAAPLDPEPNTGFELEQVTEHLNANGVSVYAVTTGNSTELSEFAQIAEQTGGSSYVCSSDAEFEQVMNDVIDSIPDSLHIHAYDEFTTTATCTEGGSISYVCSGCHKEITTTIPALGHDYSEEWTVDVEADCENDGSQSRHCSRCDDKTDVTAIPALGHAYGEWIKESDPTCTAVGITYQQCAVCEDKNYDSIPALGHTETSEVIAPDCDDWGYTLYTCSVCGETRKDSYVDPLGHTETFEVIAPDCDDRGYTLYTCTVCGATRKDNYVDALGHTETSEVFAPDCDDRGYTLYTCSVCSATRRDNYVDPLGHSYGQWIVDKEATVLAEGSQHRICSACSYNQAQVIPAIEIDIDENANYGLAVFTVVNAQTLEPIHNAQIFISTEEDGENTFATDANGQVSVVLPVGKQAAAVFASGCLTRNLNIVIRPGVNEIQQIGLSDKPTYDAEITATEMTYEEIVDAGIDVSAPGNQHVYKYEVQLNFEAEIDMDSIFAYFNSNGSYIGGWAGDGDDDDDDDDDDDKKPNNPSPGPIRVPVNDEVLSVYPITEYFYLIIRGEVTWLKEMFDVEMLVINNSNTDTLEDLTATLTLPEGLSLANMVGQEQTLAQHIDHVAEGETETVHWYVRGDNAGSYSLEARLQGTIMPFEEPIDDVFYAEDQIQVWAGNAMHLHFEFPNAAYHADDYPIRITLTNVSDKPLYNVQHLVQAVQGMEIYYSDETSKTRIEGSDWSNSGVAVFNPGDQIIIESTINIFFESEIMERKLQSMIGVVDGIEKAVKAIKVVKAGIDLIGGLYKCADECAEVLGKHIPTMVNESVEKAKLVKELYDAIADLNDTQATTGDEMLDEILKVGDSGLSTTLQVITSDPEAWVDGSNLEEISDLIKEVKGLKKTIDTTTTSGRKFDLYDSLRTAISAIPIRYVLASVVLTEDPNNTTSIPWSYSAYPADPQYFGVSSVSKYLDALSAAIAAEVYDEVAPGFFVLIPGLDDPFNSEEAIRYIQATEDEIAKVKAKDATGEVSFTARVETRSRSAEPSFLLSSDNESAYVDENGVLHFTGDGMIEILPQGLSSGVLYIEDSLGNQYTYNINVAPAHTHTEGDVEVIIPPMGDTDGFGAVLCEVCGDMIDVVELSADTCGGNHSFGDWETLTEVDCEANGTQIRSCSVCGTNEYAYTEAPGHNYTTVSQDPTCTDDGFITNSCDICGTVKTETIPAPGHDWIDATCTTAKVCEVCGTTEGDALGHSHTLENTYNSTGDGRHDVFCGDCGTFIENVSCEYDPLTYFCVCGAGGTGWRTDSQGTTYLSNGVVIYKQTMATIEGDTYYFDADGYIVKDIVSWDGSLVAMDRTTGKRMDGYQGVYTAADGELYYIEDAVAVANKGLVKVTLEDGHVHYYYFGCCEAGCGSDCSGNYKAQKNTTHRAYITNDLLMNATFTFDADGVILHNADTSLQGIKPDENGVDCYYEDGVKLPKGLFIGEDGQYYYADLNGEIVKDCTCFVGNTNGLTYEGKPVVMGTYVFDAQGALMFDADRNGFFFENGGWCYYLDDKLNYAGLIWCNGPEGNDPGYYYVNSKCMLITDCTYWITKNNGLLMSKNYHFDENGTMDVKNGFYFENGAWYYYLDEKLNYAGLIWCNGPEGNDPGYYYVNSNGMLVTNCTYWITKNNGHMESKNGIFDENGTLVGKNGFYCESGVWYYYVDDKRNYAGLIWCDGPMGNAPGYYYVNSKGMLVTDCTYWITKNNGHMESQNCTFDENGKLVQN